MTRKQIVSRLLEVVALAAIVALVVLMWSAQAGCSTVHQSAVEAAAPGSYVPPVRTEGGYLVDGTFRDRYNALVGVYGRKRLENGAPVFVPPLERDQGLTARGPDQWFMKNEAMENMVTLVALQHRGAAP